MTPCSYGGRMRVSAGRDVIRVHARLPEPKVQGWSHDIPRPGSTYGREAQDRVDIDIRARHTARGADGHAWKEIRREDGRNVFYRESWAYVRRVGDYADAGVVTV
eukprot:CAMPEP_0196218250 /NCGR_PEP_ID=MMETSP0912-20130531/36163_1 /TAXON_ID=49265 /ORGANISM="Thalassiosira rotula, Strain GSO102" /LENGTH=104 /DNA_ID=CAMNT_0041495879 /DNA_START=52 /DNA_END=367 /DNA_ORIENTATION=+